jgi:DNA ligase-1
MPRVNRPAFRYNSSMEVVEILRQIRKAQGTNEKKRILESHKENVLLKKVLMYGLDSFRPFNIVKIPKVKSRSPKATESSRWEVFFEIADMCAERRLTGNEAVLTMSDAFSVVSEEEEKVMRKILKKHLSIGASTKTVNKIFPGLIPVFEVSLAQKFQEKRIKGKEEIAIEPKLDGIRCFAIVDNGSAQLFARSGKIITNFDNTIGEELRKLGDGCYDGELMGEDFTAIMRQAYRKESIDTNGTYLALFDYLPIEEWKSGKTSMSCFDRREVLLDKLTDNDICLDLVSPVDRMYISDWTTEEIFETHDEYVKEGFEGVMIKDPEAPYRFGRGYEVMKLKAFHDVDLAIKGLLEGTGRHTGKLGSVIVDYNGVNVQVGSGFSDDLREDIWSNKDHFMGRMIEVRYQEVTPDGSLRFPTFVCFRNDR